MDARDLYGLPLERFVAERSGLAKELRSQGRREEAATVAKLPKPSVAAWAVNQLVRTQHRAIAELFEAGDALQSAQSDVISGRGSASALREAADRERAAVRTLSAAARGLLTGEGHALTGATLERVTETLHAAALDPEARDEVHDGCLTRELKHIGLGSGSPPAAAPRRSGRARDQAERERRARLEAARKAEADARHAAEHAAQELQRAQERRDRAAQSLRAAEQALSEATDRAEEAARALREAQQAVERA
jgi:hypothetical protein